MGVYRAEQALGWPTGALSGELEVHEQAVFDRVGVVVGALASLGEAEGLVEGDGRGVGGADFKPKLLDAGDVQGFEEGLEELAGESAALAGRWDGDGFKLGLGREKAGEGETVNLA